MHVLALDTATPAITAGLVAVEAGTPPHTVAERVTVHPRAHAELLTPQAMAVLAGVGRPDAVVVGVGPGPFTGLRVGMVTAAALGHAFEVPVYPVCTLDAIAAGVTAPVHGLLVVTDARRREVYWARYGADGRRLAGPAVNAPADVSGEVAAGAAGLLPGVRAVPPEYPRPAGLVAAAAEQLLAGAEPGPLTPLYLRRPDADLPAARKSVLPGGAR